MKSYPNPELFGIRLPVNLLAYNFCKTQRDVFLFIMKTQLPESWDRYEGRVIHSYYEILFENTRKIINEASIDELNIFDSLLTIKEDLINEAIRKHNRIFRKLQSEYDPDELIRQTDQLKEKINKIFRFEISLIAGLVNFEISRLFNQDSGEPLFQKAATMQIGQQYTAPALGFSDPVSPDFIYKQVVGDIKSGPWQEYYYYTVTAYALAVENHLRQDVNCGIILHVDLDRPRKIPICEKTQFIHIDDSIRRKFVSIRDQKLYIAKYKEDPGLPENNNSCNGCGYYNTCWGEK